MSNQYLTILSIGPVQEFIASARKSRDLWSGSWLLSELSKACAKSLYEQGAELFFPYVKEPTDLEKDSEFSVVNRIQVIITANSPEQLQTVINQAKQAINQRFADEVNTAFKNIPNKSDIRQNIWDKQKEDYIDIQSAWAKIDNSIDDAYGKAVALASRVLTARKATRDFSASCANPYDKDFMLPKSSFDGVRETVLEKDVSNDKKDDNPTRIKLNLSKSEQLDCMGVVKRLGFEKKAEQFTPLSRVATDSWIELVLKDNPTAFDDIKNSYDKLVQGMATRVKGNKKGDKDAQQSIYHDFPYDAEFLYESRLMAEINQWNKNKKEEKENKENKESDTISSELKKLHKLLTPLWKTYGQPQSYGVMLLADGDKMGNLLAKATSKEDHQEISQALSKFAKNVRSEMQSCRGHCIYAGGDDVLGLMPLDKAYECADKLQKKFNESLQEVAERLNAPKPTLSVGLAICHQMTPFAVIRDLAKQAEKYAKGDHCQDAKKRRNALGIVLSIRSGADIKLRLRWDDLQAHDKFNKWIQLYLNKKLPSRVAYSVRDIQLHTQAIAQDDTALHTKIQSAELERMLKKARTPNGKELEENDINNLKSRGENIGLATLADELMIARWLASKTQKDLGRE